jgi:hypothetical protein
MHEILTSPAIPSVLVTFRFILPSPVPPVPPSRPSRRPARPAGPARPAVPPVPPSRPSRRSRRPLVSPSLLPRELLQMKNC